ncbi:MAG: ABC-F family ATP-binding cassette domain-containing protein [Bacteroidetes bacterium]|jgi:ATP-binding cassette, subfamily F, member 3|nr:ABC-F family ATP-binding cassette domain-containing protein [Bacteroidota bacterium]MBT5529716.1 ABC-F family ATP-binding cassette domain-containing protein [Cytophagia bacterium]MBT3423779.1 ABC-F family ATP-binding cassette domain-containing protein [Bacteroidota bacterium]MBT3799695.1 ABC-F family ATP-binding cassette domain-containing protein [Bacteroidota bacterium]MBT3934513.1 ABC-F family ATP-binding cassette domain-containing protein [Bacteroidota bacterium]
MYSISGLSVSFSGIEIFNNISFLINARDRIGLVGKNGVGKSTLLTIMAGLQQAEKGSFSYPQEKYVSYLPQELRNKSHKSVYDETSTAFNELIELKEEIDKLNSEIENFEDFESDRYYNLLDRLNEKTERLSFLDDEKNDGLIEKILKGLGFRETDFHRNMSEFSGGWQMRVELAKILLRKPDLLLLDEPTNHLDIESILWMENFLKNYSGAIVMVSHDRMFLDNICNKTVELINGKIYDYNLPYSKFLEVRDERLKSQYATALNQQKYIEQQERFIERFRAKNTKAKQVKSKIKRLDKIERIEYDEVDKSQISFRFPPAPRSGTIVLEAEGCSKKYDQNVILKNLEFVIERGERIAFVGKNGEGKTTLVKMIINEIAFDGTLKSGHQVEVGYYAQVQEKSMDDNLSVLQTIEDVATGEWSNISRVRGLLGAFLFDENDVDKKVRVLSGGEKSRLALAKLLLKPVNLLILDEPTNHLDIQAKEVLKQALLQYDGTLILVSHDRDFLQGLTTRTFEFKNKKIKEHLGNVSEFLSKHSVQTFREFESNKNTKSSKNTKLSNLDSGNKEQYEQKKEYEKQVRKLKNAVSKAEAEIAAIDRRIAELDLIMQKPEFYDDYAESSKVMQNYTKINSDLLTKFEEWENKNAALEKLQADSPL